MTNNFHSISAIRRQFQYTNLKLFQYTLSMTRLLFFKRHFEGNTHLNFNEIIHGTGCVISTLVKKELLFITTSLIKICRVR